MEYQKIDINDPDALIVAELEREFDFEQYDLDEKDILRTIKINKLLERYKDVFEREHALQTFYVISRATPINLQSVFKLINLDKEKFLDLIKEMRFYELIDIDAANVIELTKKGKKYAQELGVDIFL
jgi:predicted transcriptional regulator